MKGLIMEGEAPNQKSAGRPSKYNEEILVKAKEYVENHKDYGDVVPNVAGLCCELGINKVTAYDWAKQPSKLAFSNTLDELQQKQERLLLSGGLSGDNNASITKLMLCNHGYSDKAEQDSTSDVENLIKALSALSGKLPV